MKKMLFIGLLCCVFGGAHAQLLDEPKTFSRADSLRGQLTPLRTCYDIDYYHLDVRVDPDRQYISGSNLFRFTATADFAALQFDLFENLTVEKVVYHGETLPVKREFNAVFIQFPEPIAAGQVDSFTVHYSGRPIQAKKAPWDGGFVFKTDANGNHWIATACQGLGASAWWPNKDHLTDEVDSMLISVRVPNGLINVSNGRLRSRVDMNDGYTRFDWFVSNPINNYNVALNIGDYVHLTDTFRGEKGVLDLDYWVLRKNEAKARTHFRENVKPMLRAFEYWFGPYPFYSDGYKLVETPYLGMEHQSAIAYGNKYENGYLGVDGSGTGWGMKWDFIIVHESGHEWFGNNITASDLADMWIHESFTNYSEALYIEYHYGKRASREYLFGNRSSIQNNTPIIGQYGVNNEGSADMYNKGGVLLNMVRTIIDNDERWRQILRGLNQQFHHRTVTYTDIVSYISEKAGKDLSKVFAQYVRHPNIPTLAFRFDKDGAVSCHWIADVAGFDMPVRIRSAGGEYQFVQPSTERTPVFIENLTPENLEVDTINYYIDVMMNE